MRGWLTERLRRGEQFVDPDGEEAADRLLDVGEPNHADAIALEIGQNVPGGRKGDRLARRQAVGLEAIEGSLDLADARAKTLRDQFESLIGNAGRQSGRLAGNDGPARLEVGRLHAADDAGDKARDQLFAQFGEEPRMTVGAQHDLAVARFKLANRVQELFLDHALAVEEIDVIHDEHVDAAKPLAKAGQRAVAQRCVK